MIMKRKLFFMAMFAIYNICYASAPAKPTSNESSSTQEQAKKARIEKLKEEYEGLDLNSSSNGPGSNRYLGEGLLHEAAKKNDLELLIALSQLAQESGNNEVLNQRTFYLFNTPAHYAAESVHQDSLAILKVLIDAGANISLKSADGSNVLKTTRLSVNKTLLHSPKPSLIRLQEQKIAVVQKAMQEREKAGLETNPMTPRHDPSIPVLE